MEFHHVGISVSSLDQSIAFYRDKMGMDLLVPPFPMGGKDMEDVTALEDLTVRVCIIGKGSLTLELFEFENPRPQRQDPNYPVNDHGITHFGILVEDIDETYRRLAAEDIRFHSDVREFPSGIRAVYGRDPDGNVFELLEMPTRRKAG